MACPQVAEPGLPGMHRWRHRARCPVFLAPSQVATASNAGSTDFCLLEGDPDSPDWLESSGDYIFAPCA